jgi:hypothetical protein
MLIFGFVFSFVFDFDRKLHGVCVALLGP